MHRLFALKSKPQRGTTAVAAGSCTLDRPRRRGPFVQMCRVGDRWVGVPVSAGPYHLPEADGVIANDARDKDDGDDSDGRDAEVTLLESGARVTPQLVIAGCESRGDAAGPAGRRSLRRPAHPGRGVEQAGARTAA